MNYKVGDYVTRDSYNNDIIFKIIDINNDIAYLKGVNVRLCADSNLSDLRLTNNIEENDDSFIDDTFNDIDLDRSEYFYLPGSILHIDGDEEYLSRCMNFYEKMHVKANGIHIIEKDMTNKVNSFWTRSKISPSFNKILII